MLLRADKRPATLGGKPGLQLADEFLVSKIKRTRTKVGNGVSRTGNGYRA